MLVLLPSCDTLPSKVQRRMTGSTIRGSRLEILERLMAKVVVTSVFA
jgi:hypothetical protein